MEFKQINQLMVAMRRTGIKKLKIVKEGVELELERDSAVNLPFDTTLDFEENPLRQDFERHHQSHSPIMTLPEATKAEKAIEKDDASSVYVTSPMVGTIYYAPSPNDPLFVKPGDRVEKNTVVCIIEAMKVMNEVKATVAGIIGEPLVENGHPVEFGTKIFRVIPA